MINTGAGGVSFDNDEAIGPDEDEDLRSDPIAQIDLKVRLSRLVSLSPLVLIKCFRIDSSRVLYS